MLNIPILQIMISLTDSKRIQFGAQNLLGFRAGNVYVQIIPLCVMMKMIKAVTNVIDSSEYPSIFPLYMLPSRNTMTRRLQEATWTASTQVR